ncbi:MAG: enoyl-CoA hydratase-related protein [Myxococcota bacterium]
MAYETILVEQRGPVAVLTLNRPKSLNALNRQLITELTRAYDELIAAGATRAVVLTGSGEKAFAAGADISEMKGMSALDAKAFSTLGHTLGARIETAPFPTIAAVNGFALGGGCELALCCDFIYAAEEAKLGQPEVNLGLIPGFGGCTRLVRRVGPAWARELVLAADPIPASEALRIGLVNKTFPRASLLDEANKTATKIAEKGPVAVTLARQVILNTEDLDLARANALEQQAFGLAASSTDSQEGMTAFLEKRPAKFTGK